MLVTLPVNADLQENADPDRLRGFTTAATGPRSTPFEPKELDGLLADAGHSAVAPHEVMAQAARLSMMPPRRCSSPASPRMTT